VQELSAFLRAVGKHWWSLLSCAFFTILGLFVAYANKSNAWVVQGSFIVAALCLLIACYRAWRDEHTALEDEIAKNQKPELKIELLASFFEVSPHPSQNLQVNIYAYLRVTNVREPATLIKSGTMTMTVNGIMHTGNGDDVSRTGAYILHNTDFKVGDETKGTFPGVFSKVQRLLPSIGSENPLQRGVHREGLVVFAFPGVMDWNPEYQPTLAASDLCLTLVDSFDGRHTLKGNELNIFTGTIKSKIPTNPMGVPPALPGRQ